MVKNKYKKIVVIILIVILLFMSIASGILAGNRLHTQNCQLSNCSLCVSISIMTNLFKNIVVLQFCTSVLFCWFLLLKLTYKAINKLPKLTLVDEKVVQNK